MSVLARPFVADGRARLVWRVIAYLFFCTLMRFLGSRLYLLADGSAGGLGLALVGSIVRGGGVVLVTLAFRRWIDRRPWGPMAFGKPRARDIAFGAISAALLTFAIFGTELAMGWIRVVGYETDVSERTSAMTIMLSGIVICASIGIDEELLYRGYLLANVAERRTTIAATLATGVMFGLAHAHLPGFGPRYVVTTVLFTVLTVGSRILTGSIWFAVAFHASWDLVQGAGLGLSLVSAPDFDHALVHLEQTGPELWVGPHSIVVESGLLYLIALCIGIVPLLWAIHARGKSGEWLRPIAAGLDAAKVTGPEGDAER